VNVIYLKLHTDYTNTYRNMLDINKIPRGTDTEYPVLGDVQESPRLIETYRMSTEKVNGKTLLTNSNDQPSQRRDVDISWLPAAAETYHISPNPKDYILTPVSLVTIGIPNRNGQAFPLEEVTYFDHRHGMMIFRTFVWKPTFENHDNQDPTKAKGTHFDAWLEFVPRYNVWKINVLTAWDRTKDTKLVNDILNRKRRGYSMGSLPIAAGELVHTQFGWLPIEQIDINTTVETRGRPKSSKGKIYQGIQPVRTLSTKAGFQLKLADDHPVQILTEDFQIQYLRADQIKSGMYVGLRQKEYETWPEHLYFNDFVSLESEIDNRQLECQICHDKFSQLQSHVSHIHAMNADTYKNTFSVSVMNASNIRQLRYPKEMTPELARLIGYILSEGCLAQSGAITFSNMKTVLIDDFIRCCNTVFGAGTVHRIQDDGEGHLCAVISAMSIYHFFEYLGLTTDKSHDKFVPWSIFQAPKQCVIEFIKAFWEGDGSARTAGCVAFYSSSFKLLQHIQLLLLSLGIPSENSGWNDTRYNKHNEKIIDGREYYYEGYMLSLWSQSVDLFIDKIGAITDERWRDLCNLKVSKGRQLTRWHNVIPGVKEKIDDLYNKFHYGSGNYNVNGEHYKLKLYRIELMDSNSICYNHFDHYPMLISNLSKLDPIFGERLKRIYDLRLMWDKVVDVEVSPIEQPVYCVQDVEEEHNFIAQGLVVSNCEHFLCSNCGKMNTNLLPCIHILNKGAIFNGYVAYQICVSTRFTETSSVEDPADICANGDEIKTLI